MCCLGAYQLFQLSIGISIHTKHVYQEIFIFQTLLSFSHIFTQTFKYFFMPNKSTEDSDADMVDGEGMILSHRQKRSASPSLPHRSTNDGDRSAKKLKRTRPTRSASFPPHCPPMNSNRSAKKSKRTNRSDDVIPVLMGEASASTRNKGPSPVPSPAPVGSRSTAKNQQAHTTVNFKRTRSASPSLPHGPPTDSDRSAKKLKTADNSGDTIQVPLGEEEEGLSKHDSGPYPVPSLPPVDSMSTKRSQQAHTGILPTSKVVEKPNKRKLEVMLNLSHRPKKPTVDMPTAKRPRLPQKTRSVFPSPKAVGNWSLSDGT